MLTDPRHRDRVGRVAASASVLSTPSASSSTSTSDLVDCSVGAREVSGRVESGVKRHMPERSKKEVERLPTARRSTPMYGVPTASCHPDKVFGCFRGATVSFQSCQRIQRHIRGCMGLSELIIRNCKQQRLRHHWQQLFQVARSPFPARLTSGCPLHWHTAVDAAAGTQCTTVQEVDVAVKGYWVDQLWRLHAVVNAAESRAAFERPPPSLIIFLAAPSRMSLGPWNG